MTKSLATISQLTEIPMTVSVLKGFGPFYNVRREIVSSSALLTLLVGWHTSAVSLPPSDVILAELACSPE